LREIIAAIVFWYRSNEERFIITFEFLAEMSLSELCCTYLYSELNGLHRKTATRYLVNKIRNRDRGSNFEKQLGCMSILFKSDSLASISMKLMQLRGYDAILLDLKAQVIGHTGFQIHTDSTLHAFSIEVDNSYRKKGYAVYIAENLIKYAREKKIDRIRTGSENNKIAYGIHQKLATIEKELMIKTEANNWIKILGVNNIS